MAGFARDLTQAMGAAIGRVTGHAFTMKSAARVPGASVHRTLTLVSANGERYFVKINRLEYAAHFEAEIDGLRALRSAGARVPTPLATGTSSQHAFIVLEHLDLVGNRALADDRSATLAHMLADLHEVTATRFGWKSSNFIGATTQSNTQTDAWVDFFRDERIIPQLKLAQHIGHEGAVQDLGERVLDALPALFDGHQPVPSLLHGDLWSGNFGFTADGEPVIFDPAVYYGDREADLAMTELFGGFPRDFHEAYFAIAPVDAGYALRKHVYNLYHVLNHLNLFGAAYRAQAEGLMRRLLAEVA